MGPVSTEPLAVLRMFTLSFTRRMYLLPAEGGVVGAAVGAAVGWGVLEA